jgi:hypothetical protein
MEGSFLVYLSVGYHKLVKKVVYNIWENGTKSL